MEQNYDNLGIKKEKKFIVIRIESIKSHDFMRLKEKVLIRYTIIT